MADRDLGDREARAEIEAGVSSRRVAERLRFRLAGRLDAAEQFGERWRDQLRYVLDADAWRAPGRAG